MRKLLNTLYVTSPDTYLSLDGENLVVLKQQQEAMRLPLHNLESIIAFGYTGASPALMGKCARDGIALSFVTQHGRFLARIVGEENGNVTLRRTQYRAADDTILSARLAARFLQGKLFNTRWVLERAIRDYAHRLDITPLEHASAHLANSIAKLANFEDIGRLRGIEGEAASVYFSVLDLLILQQKESFFFRGRNKRPPLDKVNALLSFVYTLLAHDCASALEAVGLDAYVGFLHRDRPGRTSLALDLMEELRVTADRFVLSLINRKEITTKGFTQKENGAVIMIDETRKTILRAWQERKKEIITHPFLEEKLEWGLIPYAQAMLLARFLRGDLDDYPPFLWK